LFDPFSPAPIIAASDEIETELIKATELKKLFLDSLTEEDVEAIRCDTIAAATRSPSLGLASLAILFQTGLHALVCYRVGHRLWQQNRTGLAYYLQSTVSRQYSADIHPACRMGRGIYLRTASGLVIGETASVGDDVCILQGVTLGGTGKESGDRHPKVQHGVVLHDSATVLGNIQVGTGAVISAKAIVTKPVAPLAIMSGVPAKPTGTRELTEEAFEDNLERHLAIKYLDEWRALKMEMDSKAEEVQKARKG
jgi:serine O-acetyltransferase